MDLAHGKCTMSRSNALASATLWPIEEFYKKNETLKWFFIPTLSAKLQENWAHFLGTTQHVIKKHIIVIGGTLGANQKSK